MPTHITARVAWHLDGWNGHVCRNPATNRYCVGQHSYPGTKIQESRNLEWELEVAGQSCAQLTDVPPCIFSINAFGAETLTAADTPPSFFKSGARTQWALPPATVCIWPYDSMYNDEAYGANGRVDNTRRLEMVKEYLDEIEPAKSLVFHYANYSNPLSTDDEKRYAVVGLARIKRIGDINYYDNVSSGYS